MLRILPGKYKLVGEEVYYEKAKSVDRPSDYPLTQLAVLQSQFFDLLASVSERLVRALGRRSRVAS